MVAKGSVVGFVGFDEISLELADSLVSSGYAVQAYDSQSDGPSMDEFSGRLGGTRCTTAMEATKGVVATILLISHPAQIDDMIFGGESILNGLEKNVVVVLRTSTKYFTVQNLEKRLTEEYELNAVVDAHIFRGTSEDLNGKLMMVSSGKSNAVAIARPVLSAMCAKLYVFEGEIGAGSKVKMVTELLEAIHLVASVEAICLGVQAKIHPCILYDIISNAAGNSWVFKHHVAQWLSADHMKHETLDTLLENLVRLMDDLGKICNRENANYLDFHV